MNADSSLHIDDVSLNEYLYSALAPEPSADDEADLTTCPVCAARLADLRALFATLATLPDAPLERDLAHQVLAALQPRPAPLPPIARWAFMAQAMLAMVFTVIATLVLAYTITPADSFIDPAVDSFTQMIESLITQWQATWASAQSTIASLLDSTLTFLPKSFEWTWFAGLVAVLVLWLAGNGVILRRIISSPSRSHS